MEYVMCIALFVLCVITCGYAQYESCATPENKPGQCINIGKCPQLLVLLKKRPLSQYAANYLKRAQCGFENLDPKVCCPLDYDKEEPPKLVESRPDLLPNTDECGYIGDSRIVGGEEADLFDFPWMALIEFLTPDGRGFYCGGVLISKRYILTAAHCVKGRDLPKDWKLTSVRLGEHNIVTATDCELILGEKVCSDTPMNVPVAEQIAHEDFDPFDRSQHHDIALLRLVRDVDFTDFIKPICVPVSSELRKDDFAGTNMTVAGWGKTETRSDSDVKLKLMIPVKSLMECRALYDAARVYLSEGQLCAGGLLGKDTCRGDSGGPLMTVIGSPGVGNWYVGGIVSFGPTPCGLEGWPGIYTRITEYVPWILRNLKP